MIDGDDSYFKNNTLSATQQEQKKIFNLKLHYQLIFALINSREYFLSSQNEIIIRICVASTKY